VLRPVNTTSLRSVDRLRPPSPDGLIESPVGRINDGCPTEAFSRTNAGSRICQIASAPLRGKSTRRREPAHRRAVAGRADSVPSPARATGCRPGPPPPQMSALRRATLRGVDDDLTPGFDTEVADRRSHPYAHSAPNSVFDPVMFVTNIPSRDDVGRDLPRYVPHGPGNLLDTMPAAPNSPRRAGYASRDLRARYRYVTAAAPNEAKTLDIAPAVNNTAAPKESL
jgi:hypothetical protein